MPVELRFIALSKAVGRSLAPGGFVFLLGLPCGVLVGWIKLFGLPLGVLGREGASPEAFSFPPGKKLDMKLAIVYLSTARMMTTIGQ